MTPAIKWAASSEWKTRVYADRNQVALVEVKRWSFREPGDEGYERHEHGRNNWNVYATIWPEHPLFALLSDVEDYMDSGAISAMPLHGGCTFMEKYHDHAGKVVSVKVGCDYMHAWDERFNEYATREDAGEVFRDAEELVVYLTNLPTGSAQ